MSDKIVPGTAEFESVVKRVYQISEQIKALKAEEDELKAALDVTEGERYVAGPYIVKASPNHRFNASLAEASLSRAKYKSILKSVPDAKLAAAVLKPEDLEKCFKSFAPRVAIELP